MSPIKMKRRHFEFSKLCVPCGRFKTCLSDFCTSTSIHGFKFLAGNQRTVVEKIWWTTVIILSCYFCFNLIWSSYNKWVNSPVVVTLASNQTYVWEIPFPAVTICPVTKTQRNIFNFTDIILKYDWNLTTSEEEDEYYRYISLTCNHLVRLSTEDKFMSMDNITRILTKMAPEFKVINVGFSSWHGLHLTKSHFKPIFTSEGLCYSFNSLPAQNIYAEQVFSDLSNKGSEDEDSYLHFGTNGGINVLLRSTREDLDYMCSEPLQGFKVNSISLHNPKEVSNMESNYFRLALDEVVEAAIKPRIIKTADALQSYPPRVKQCYFQEDNDLKFFKIYTQRNCLNECLTNITLKTCGCVAFYMPRHNSTPVCGPALVPCVKNVQVEFMYREGDVKLGLGNTDANFDFKCSCLPSCTSLDFDVELSKTACDWKQTFEVFKHWKEWQERNKTDDITEMYHLSQLVLRFKDMQTMTAQRHEIYGTADFWASCGGLLGLCMGISVLSVFEILYFLTIKALCTLKYARRVSKVKSVELVELNIVK